MSVIGQMLMMAGRRGDGTPAPTIPNWIPGQKVAFYGDSITLGIAASDNAHQWTTLLSGFKSGNEQNFGISGTTMENQPSTGRTPFNPSVVATYNTGYSFCFVAFGVNCVDVGSPFTVGGFEAALGSAIDTIVGTKGWPANRVVIVSPFWFTKGSKQTELLSYTNTAQDVATLKGCTFVNIYDAMLNDPNNNTFLNADQLHPNNTGHAFIADFFNAAIP